MTSKNLVYVPWNFQYGDYFSIRLLDSQALSKSIKHEIDSPYMLSSTFACGLGCLVLMIIATSILTQDAKQGWA